MAQKDCVYDSHDARSYQRLGRCQGTVSVSVSLPVTCPGIILCTLLVVDGCGSGMCCAVYCLPGLSAHSLRIYRMPVPMRVP